MAWTRVMAVVVGDVVTFWEYVWKEESVGPAAAEGDVRGVRKRGVMVFKEGWMALPRRGPGQRRGDSEVERSVRAGAE